MQEMGNEMPQVKMPLALGKAQEDGAFGRIGPQNLVEDGLQQEDAEGVEHAHRGQQQHAGQPLKRVGQPVAQKAEKPLHAGRPACRIQRLDAGMEWVAAELHPTYCIRALYGEPRATGMALTARALFDEAGGGEAFNEGNDLDFAAPGLQLPARPRWSRRCSRRL